MPTLAEAIVTVSRHVTHAETTLGVLQTQATDQQELLAMLAETDAVLRALLQTKSEESFAEVERLLLRGLQTVFGPSWNAVHLTCTAKAGRLHAELTLKHGDVEGPVLDTFGGGPAALVSFLLRVLVLRRTKLAPVILLDETFSQVSADFLPDLSKFLRLLVDRLGMTLLLVTHLPVLADSATKVYEAKLMPGNRTVFTDVTTHRASAPL